MKSINLPADVREVLGKKVDNLRREGKVPGVLYGHGTKNKNLVIDQKILKELIKQGGTSSLVDLELDKGKPIKVLVQDIQRNVVTGEPIHIDLHQINMKEKITTDVELKFVGVSKAVKELGGVLLKNTTKVTIECLPEFLVDMIEVNIGKLETFEENIKIKDLIVPKGITIKGRGDLVVVNVQPPRSDEELKALDEKVEDKVAEVKGIDEEKEEGAEGEADKKEEGAEGEADKSAQGGSTPASPAGRSGGKEEKKKVKSN
ncbi:MAG: 50S ribosomal protein L25 [bacterium]|nr:50S ribosomal protein L25 [bacterium]